MEEIFKTKKPIIGVVHLKPLIGSPDYNNNFEEVLEFALKDAKNLEDGGVDGILIENFHDKPYYKDNVPKHTVASISIISNEIKKNISIPIGINVLRNDAFASLAIASVIKAQFIRVNVYIGAVITDQGIIEGKAHLIQRYKKFLMSNVKIFADVLVKHSYPFPNVNIINLAKDAYYRGKADALIVTGKVTGDEPDIENIINLKREINAPILAGSGINIENVEKFLKFCDGAIVGTFFKENGKIENKVDIERVKKFMKIVKKIREE